MFRFFIVLDVFINSHPYWLPALYHISFPLYINGVSAKFPRSTFIPYADADLITSKITAI